MPWFRKDNPFDPEPEEPKKKENPSTIVEVECEGCVSRGESFTMINVRIKAGKSTKQIQCHRCLHLIDVEVSPGGQVTVYQSNQNGSERHQTSFEKVWQE